MGTLSIRCQYFDYDLSSLTLILQDKMQAKIHLFFLMLFMSIIPSQQQKKVINAHTKNYSRL